jgi:hypothetical protein
MENLYFAVGYTIVIVVVAFFYYNQGKLSGIEEACTVFREKEPDAFKRMRNSLKEDLGIAAE